MIAKLGRTLHYKWQGPNTESPQAIGEGGIKQRINNNNITTPLERTAA